VFKELMLKQN